MKIQHNIPAMNAYRNYNANAAGLNKNLEKLSSGYKINRAGDDAAGLAISEKMRAQITGLEVAKKNAKDGISVVQTAEGALTEVHDMLNRMYSLAEQSANGTYKESERVKLQQEVNQLSTEIDRIADSTNFNGLKLLDGSMKIQNAGSEKISQTGTDRILKSVIGEDEKAYDVAGVKTVTDMFTESAAKAVFEVRFQTTGGSGIKFNANISNASKTGSVSMPSITIRIGDLEIETKESDIKCHVQAGEASAVKASVVVSAIVSKINSQYLEGVTINGVKWSVAATAGGNALQFTQKNKPQNEDEARANFDVSISFGQKIPAASLTASNSSTAEIGWSTNETLPVGTVVTTQGVPEGSKRNANTVFSMSEKDIVDGAKIRLGNGTKAKTYILKIGTNSKVTTVSTSTERIVDLTSMDPNKVNLNKALSALAKTINEKDSGTLKYKYTYRLTNGTTSQATATFSVGVSDGKNGMPVGLAVKRIDTLAKATQANVMAAYFDSIEKFDNMFSLNYERKIAAQDGLKLQIGDTADAWNQLKVSVNDMHASALGLSDIDITTADGAATAMDKIMSAIDLVSETRSDLGAIQNRLDHTLNNLSVTRENLQDAESTIRDTDVAEEMMTYTKNSILNQAAQAMLAQANQLPQGVLQLLG